MPINIIVSNAVGFKVKGAINNAAGIPQPFDFNLTAQRLDSEEMQAKLTTQSDASLTDFLNDVVTGWSGVKGEDDKPLEFTEVNFRALLKIPGLAALAFRTYIQEAGAKEKN